MLEHWIARYGYEAIALGTFVEGETVLLIGGALAHRGLLQVQGVMLAALVGSLVGDQLWFLLGRRFGPGFVQRRPALQRPLARAQRALTRYGTRFVLLFRFVAGIRTVSPFLLGASGYPTGRFALLNGVGAALWSVVVTLLGYSLGAGVERMLARAGRVEELALAALGLGALATFLVRRLWRRRTGAGD